MTALIIILCVILISIVLVQIGKVTELTTQIKGESEAMRSSSRWNSWLSLIFMIGFLLAVSVSAWQFRNVMFGFGPHEAASAHGGTLDAMLIVTIVVTGIVFFLTQIALFYFAWKYRWQEGRKAQYIAHDNRLEVWWTVIPAVVMTFLVVRGLNAWNTVMADIADTGEDYMEIEATGQQFNWIIRYPGPDGQLGARNFRLTTGDNPLGQDFTDRKNWDDLIPSQEIYLPVGKKVRVRITAKDVLHNFYLPHFRLKMDAVPGMPTYFVFTPTKTTTQYRQDLRKYPEYNVPADPADPNGPKRWEAFEYEIACAELCGKGHYSMKRILRVVSEVEYKVWLATQKSYYLDQVRDKADDPNKGKVLDFEVGVRAREFSENMKKAVESAAPADKTLTLDHVNFEPGTGRLTPDSKYELDNLVTALTTYPNLVIRISGHSDPAGDPAGNKALSEQRAGTVVKYLTDRGIGSGRLRAAGVGDSEPMAANNPEENRAQNRHTGIMIISQ